MGIWAEISPNAIKCLRCHESEGVILINVSQFFTRQLLEQEFFHMKMYFCADLNKLTAISFVFHEQHRCCLAASMHSTIDKNHNCTEEMDEVFFFSITKDLQSFIQPLPGKEERLNEAGVSVFVQFLSISHGNQRKDLWRFLSHAGSSSSQECTFL